MKKVYKILLIILFVFALNLFFAKNTHAVNFGVYDKDGNLVTNRKNNRMYCRRYNYFEMWSEFL